MKILTTALALVGLTLTMPAIAQDAQPQGWVTVPISMDCAAPSTMMGMSSDLGEQPFVAGAARLMDEQGNMVDGWLTFQVNAESETWNIMVHSYDGVYSCLLAAGSDFSAVPFDLEW